MYILNTLDKLNEYVLPMMVILFMLVEYWFLFEKVQEAGWKAVIPVYAEYTKHKIVKLEKLFWIKVSVICAMVATVIVYADSMVVNFMGFKFIKDSLGVISVICVLLLAIELTLLLIVDLKKAVAIAKLFGKTTAFGLGIAFLEPIFIGILAFCDKIQAKKEEEAEGKCNCSCCKEKEVIHDNEDLSPVTDECTNDDIVND